VASNFTMNMSYTLAKRGLNNVRLIGPASTVYTYADWYRIVPKKNRVCVVTNEYPLFCMYPL
jgi:hypothetical protein